MTVRMCFEINYFSFNKSANDIKGTGHDFLLVKKTYKSFSEARKYENISKQKLCKFAEIVKKNRVFGKFHSWKHSNNVL